MDQNPKTIWKWLFSYRQFVTRSQPNEAHKSILRLHEHCKKGGKKFSLVTQSIDGFHTALINESKVLTPQETAKEGIEKHVHSDELVELHGNANYMKCIDECHFKLYKVPDGLKEGDIPVCPMCGQAMRPHILLFDEYYSEQSRSVIDNGLSCDCMIIIGTSLKTQLPNSLIYEHVDEGKLTIEINPKEVIKSNLKNVFHITESCEKSVPLLVNEIISQ